MAARITKQSLNKLGVIAFVTVFARLAGIAALLLRLAVLLVLLTLPILLTLTALLAGLTALTRFAALLSGLARLTLLLAGFTRVTLLTSVIAVAILVVGIAHDCFLVGVPAPLVESRAPLSVPPAKRMLCKPVMRKHVSVYA